MMHSIEQLVNNFSSLDLLIIKAFQQGRTQKKNLSYLRRLAIAYIMVKYGANTVSDVKAKLLKEPPFTRNHTKFQVTRHMIKVVQNRLADFIKRISLNHGSYDKCKEKDIIDELIAVFSDAARSGAPVKDPDMDIKILAIVLSQPVPKGYGSRWTLNLINKILDVSKSTVHRCLKKYNVSLHTIESRCYSNDPCFLEKANTIITLYRQAEQGSKIVYAFDEKACEIHQQLLSKTVSRSGALITGRNSEYIRHGVTNMLTAICINDRFVFNRFYSRKASADARDFFISFMEFVLDKHADFLEKHPEEKIYVVMDNYRTHSSDKGIAGCIKNNPRYSRFELVFTPTHSSWLNLCEGFFGNIAKSVLINQSYKSVLEIQQAISSTIARWNADEPRPIRWRAMQLANNQIKWTSANLDPYKSSRLNPRLKSIKEQVDVYVAATSAELNKLIKQKLPEFKVEVQSEQQLKQYDKHTEASIDKHIEQVKQDITRYELLINRRQDKIDQDALKLQKYENRLSVSKQTKIILAKHKLKAQLEEAKVMQKKRECKLLEARLLLSKLEYKKLNITTYTQQIA